MRFNVIITILVSMMGSGVCFAEEAKTPEPPKPLEPISQVQLSAWIVEANDSGVRDIGANLEYTRFLNGREQAGDIQQINSNTMDVNSPDTMVSVPEPNRNLFPNGPRPDVNNELMGLQTRGGGGLDFAIIPDNHGTIDGLFRSRKRKSQISLLSKPEIMVVDGGEAEIHAGGEVPYQNVEFKDNRNMLDIRWQSIGVKMIIKPTILPHDFVKVQLKELEVNDVARMDHLRGVDLPVFSTRKQTGSVVIPSGSTLVVGGLTSQVERKSERRIPLLGKVPILGAPFRSRKSEKYNSNLMIFLSPTIIDLRKMTPVGTKAMEFYKDKDWDHSDKISKEKELFKGQF